MTQNICWRRWGIIFVTKIVILLVGRGVQFSYAQTLTQNNNKNICCKKHFLISVGQPLLGEIEMRRKIMATKFCQCPHLIQTKCFSILGDANLCLTLHHQVIIDNLYSAIKLTLCCDSFTKL